MNSVKLIYSDLSVGAKQNFSYSLNYQWSETRGTDLQIEDPTYNHYGTLEGNSWRLNDSFKILPDTLTSTYLGLWSSNLSNSNKTFTNPVVLTITASNNYSSNGFTMTFEELENSYPTSATVTWYRDNTVLSTKTYTITGTTYYFDGYVSNFNKVTFSFSSMNKASRYLKIYEINFGVIRTYTNKHLASTTLLEEMSSFSNELSINTFNFNLLTDDNTALYFQYKQPIKLYINNVLEGTFFVTEGNRVGANKYEVKTEDYISLLDTSYFVGGIYSSYSVEDLIEDIFTSCGVPYEIDVDTYPVSTVSGWIPYCTCREALQQVLFASGLVCDTTKSDKVNIFVIGTTSTNTYDESDVIEGKKTKTDKRITEVQLTEYAYKQNATDTQTLYDASTEGTCTSKLITFSEPYHTYTVTGGTIDSSGPNYVILTMTSDTGTLTALPYDEFTSVYSIKNSDVNVNDPENVVKCNGCTLVSSSNAQTVCQKIYNYKVEQDTVTCKVIGLEEQVGGKIAVNSDYTGSHTGYIESIEFDPVHDGSKEIKLH